jgi:hypothetical protein
VYILGVILSLAVSGPAREMTAADREEYERRGLSQVEWEMVLDSKMPMNKLDNLQKAGISVNEYFRYPWLNYGISELQWIQSRKSGLLESDIAAENKADETPGGGKVFSAFLLPGYHQFRQKQYWKGAIMTGCSAFGIVYMTASSIHSQSFIPYPLLILMVPAMLWSSLDIGFQINRECNPDAGRFSKDGTAEDSYRISLSIHSN